MTLRSPLSATSRFLSRKLSEGLRILIALVVISGMGILPMSKAWAFEENISIDLEEISEPEEELHIGQPIERLFLVKVLEDDCYIRIRTTMDSPASFALCDYESPAEEDWHLGGDGWWYLERRLSRGEDATFSSSLVIVGDADARSCNASVIELSERTTAEALSASSIDPDWSDADPWSGIEPDASASTSVIDQTETVLATVRSGGPVRNAFYAGGLAQTFDNVDPILGTVSIAGIFALFLLVIDVGYHRYKEKEEMAFPKFRASCTHRSYRSEDIDENVE